MEKSSCWFPSVTVPVKAWDSLFFCKGRRFPAGSFRKWTCNSGKQRGCNPSHPQKRTRDSSEKGVLVLGRKERSSHIEQICIVWEEL